MRFTGDTIVSSSSFIVSSNSLTNCTASSSTLSTSSPATSTSNGANAYGGGISLGLGAYSYAPNDNVFTGDTIVSSSSYVNIKNSSCFFCISKSLSGVSKQALSLGGALSIVYDSYIYPKQMYDSRIYPKQNTEISNTPLPLFQFSHLYVAECNFSQSSSFSMASSCSPGANNAAGGAVFVSAFNADLKISSSVFSDSSVNNDCTAPTSETYSLGGGLSIFRAGNVVVNKTNIMRCFARGVRQANNVFVSGGGVYIESSTSVTLESSVIAACGVQDAFAVGVLACGGGALGTRDVPAVRISNCMFLSNLDSCLAGVIFLQQLNLESTLTVDITNKSVLSTDPSISVALPVLNISCGLTCSFEQQKRFRLNVMDSTIRAHNQDQQSQSAAVLSLPRMLRLSAENSFVNCSFTGIDNIAVLVMRSPADGSVSVFCAPCSRPFTIAMTSGSMNLNNFSSFELQTTSADSCRTLNVMSQNANVTSVSENQCPFGFSFCSTIANVAVGFWANFSSDGSIGDAVRCPPNYCGCRNLPGYSQLICQLFPPFAVQFQPDDALCNGNRTGVLCGGCKLNYTQSLNGFSCVYNDICSQTMPWIWTITVLGFIIYSIYIVITSSNANNGLIMCVMFYGQLSSFASTPPEFNAAAQSSSWFSTVTQFGSIMSLYDDSCYGLNMGAYEAVAAQLCGPAIVVVVSLLLTAAAKRLQPRCAHFLQERKIDIQISFGATMVNVLLLLYSSVSSVVFQLITCQKVGPQNVVFIDGRYLCEGPVFSSLVFVAALLSIIPAVFWALLRFDKIPEAAKSAVCSPYTDSEYYWGALSLLVRFVMTAVFAAAREFPSITALALLICSQFMFGLLIMLRPYAEQRTYYMDVFCHACLIIQFALQSIVRASESLGFTVAASNSFRPTLVLAARSSDVLR
jgi:hypothetical protein